MPAIIVTTPHEGRFSVQSPYNGAFVRGARALAGQWDADARHWVFPAECIEDVRALLRRVYGEDGAAEIERVRVRVHYTDDLDAGDNGTVVVGGRVIARAFGRDSGAKLGEDIVLRQGGFSSGGSRKNWRIVVRDNTVFDILRLPAPMAHTLEEAYPDNCRIVPADGVMPAEIEEPQS